MLSNPHLATDLLKALGVHLYETWDVGPWGDPIDVVHCFSAPEHVGRLCEYLATNRQEFPVILFEGTPPPF